MKGKGSYCGGTENEYVITTCSSIKRIFEHVALAWVAAGVGAYLYSVP